MKDYFVTEYMRRLNIEVKVMLFIIEEEKKNVSFPIGSDQR